MLRVSSRFEWPQPTVVLGSLLKVVIGVLVFWLGFVIIDKRALCTLKN